MGVFYFPCNFVYWRQIANHQIYKKRVIDFIERYKHKLRENFRHDFISGGLSSYSLNEVNNQLEYENPDLIKEVVWDTINETLKILNARENTTKIEITKSILHELWLTEYSENSTVAMHEHIVNDVVIKNDIKYRPSFVLVYIVKDPNVRNTTIFVEPYMLAKSVYGMKETLFETEKEEDIGEGTVLIFPASLHHRVDMMRKPGRIMISFAIGSNNLTL